MVKRIDRHVFAAISGPCAIIFAIALAGLILEETIRLANAILKDQAPVDALISMLLYLLPEYVALSLQVSFLLGVFFGFRALNLQNALAIYYSGGASLARLAAPVAALAAVLAVMSLVVAGILQPLGAYHFERTGFRVEHGAYGIPVKAGEMMRIGYGTILFTRSFDKRHGLLTEVFIEESAATGSTVATSAKRGVLRSDPLVGNYQLQLLDGRQLYLRAPTAPSGVLDFDSMIYPLDIPAMPPFRNRSELPKEATLGALWRVSTDHDATSTAPFRARMHAMVIQSLTFLPFGLLGAALGAATPPRAHGKGAVLAMLAFVVFIQSLAALETRAANNSLSWLALWFLAAALAIISAGLFYRQSEGIFLHRKAIRAPERSRQPGPTPQKEASAPVRKSCEQRRRSFEGGAAFPEPVR